MSSFIPNPNPSSLRYQSQKTPTVQAVAEPVSKNILNRLDRMDNHPWEQDKAHDANAARWMIPYADLLTLLFGLFIALFALTKSDKTLWHDYAVKLEQSVQQVKAEKVHTEAQLRQEIGKTASLKTREQELADTLQKQLATSPELANALKIHPEARGLVISVTDNIFFDAGQSKLSPAAQQKLNVIAKALANVDRPIRIEGHTDNAPIKTSQYPSNWELSTARATSIIQYLIQTHHFPPQQLSAAGYGEFHPVANNSSIEGKQKNRRVDIVLLAPHSPTE